MLFIFCHELNEFYQFVRLLRRPDVSGLLVMTVLLNMVGGVLCILKLWYCLYAAGYYSRIVIARAGLLPEAIFFVIVLPDGLSFLS